MAVYARVHGEYKQRLEELERERRNAEALRQRAELERDRFQANDANAERSLAEARTAEAARAQLEKTSRASHDSRAAIIATADSLAEEVVRARRERDEALTQLEVLRAQFGGGAPRHLMPSAAAPVAMDFMMNLHLDKARSGSGTCRGI